MENVEFNAIVRVPIPGPYYPYIYFSNTHPLLYVINEFKICKIYFIMILITSQWNSSLWLLWLTMTTDICKNDSISRQWALTIESNSLTFNSVPLKEGLH